MNIEHLLLILSWIVFNMRNLVRSHIEFGVTAAFPCPQGFGLERRGLFFTKDLLLEVLMVLVGWLYWLLLAVVVSTRFWIRSGIVIGKFPIRNGFLVLLVLYSVLWITSLSRNNPLRGGNGLYQHSIGVMMKATLNIVGRILLLEEFLIFLFFIIVFHFLILIMILFLSIFFLKEFHEGVISQVVSVLDKVFPLVLDIIVVFLQELPKINLFLRYYL